MARVSTYYESKTALEKIKQEANSLKYPDPAPLYSFYRE